MYSALAYIARRRFQEMKGRIWTWDSASAEKESDDGFDFRRKAALTCGSTTSVTDRRSSTRARASWASGGSLGSAEAGNGERKSDCARGAGRSGGERTRARASRRLSPERQAEGGETGRARERAAGVPCWARLSWAKKLNKIGFSSLFFNFSKPFSKYILSSLFNLIQTTQY
jgi:hypothetical protein